VSCFTAILKKKNEDPGSLNPWRAGGLFLARVARARARGTRAHVRNIPSSVRPQSTVRNLESSCTGCMFLLFERL
jgi:hypothetical protein